MAKDLKRDVEVRRFVRVAKLRFEDARLLFDNERYNGAIYLGGYCVECMLKAIILSVTLEGNLEETIAWFRGSKAHEYGRLKNRYHSNLKGPRFSKRFSINCSIVDSWTSEMRYDPKQMDRSMAEDFLAAVEEIIIELNGRL